jgi:hypothetical protein
MLCSEHDLVRSNRGTDVFIDLSVRPRLGSDKLLSQRNTTLNKTFGRFRT